jgi:hypothetical protein
MTVKELKEKLANVPDNMRVLICKEDTNIGGFLFESACEHDCGVADWLEVVKVFEAAGWEWGGRWASIRDYPHVQKTFGHKWQNLMAKYNQKDFIPGHTYVNV